MKLAPFERDADAGQTFETAGISEHDLSCHKPTRYEFERKGATLNMRIPPALLEAVKLRAKAKGVPFTRYVRMLIEEDVLRP